MYSNCRSTDAEGLKTLQERYASDHLKSNVPDESAGASENSIVSALAHAEFSGARDIQQRKLGKAPENGGGVTNGRGYVWRRRDGCMWMRMRRRRRQDQNRFLDVLVKIQVTTV